MRKKLEKVDRDTQKNKVKKFIRDSNDFKSNNIYLWQNANSANNEANANVRDREVIPINVPPKNHGKGNVEKNQTTRGRINTPNKYHNNNPAI